MKIIPVLLAAVVAFPVTVASAATSRPLNAIILVAADMGWGDRGCQGHPYIKTPSIDRLARSGCRLDQFYFSAPGGSPLHAGLCTGRIQNRSGLQHLIRETGPAPPAFHHVPLEEPFLPRLLKSAGFTTAHIGKWHLSFVGRPGEPTMADTGYDRSLVLGASRNGSYHDSFSRRDEVRIQTKGAWSDVFYIDESIDFIEHAGERPFFINLWSFAPHQEVDCAPKYRALYADRSESEPYYCGTITQMDEPYGRRLDYLDGTGLAEKTIVIFTSDNGPEPHLLPRSERARGSAGGLRGGKIRSEREVFACPPSSAGLA